MLGLHSSHSLNSACDRFFIAFAQVCFIAADAAREREILIEIIFRCRRQQRTPADMSCGAVEERLKFFNQAIEAIAVEKRKIKISRNFLITQYESNAKLQSIL